MTQNHLIGLSDVEANKPTPTWVLLVGAALVAVGLYTTTRPAMKANGRKRRGRYALNGRGRRRSSK